MRCSLQWSNTELQFTAYIKADTHSVYSIPYTFALNLFYNSLCILQPRAQHFNLVEATIGQQINEERSFISVSQSAESYCGVTSSLWCYVLCVCEREARVEGKEEGKKDGGDVCAQLYLSSWLWSLVTLCSFAKPTVWDAGIDRANRSRALKKETEGGREGWEVCAVFITNLLTSFLHKCIFPHTFPNKIQRFPQLDVEEPLNVDRKRTNKYCTNKKKRNIIHNSIFLSDNFHPLCWHNFWFEIDSSNSS